MLTLLRRGLLVFLAAFPLLSMAAPTPQQVVQGTVDELLSDIKANKAAYKADPQKLYATLDRILGPVVDAEGIAKSVMTVKYFAPGLTRANQALRGSVQEQPDAVLRQRAARIRQPGHPRAA